MKIKILIVLSALLTAACAAKPVIETDACDAIMNRGSACVCGKNRVYSKCTPVPGHEGWNVAE